MSEVKNDQDFRKVGENEFADDVQSNPQVENLDAGYDVMLENEIQAEQSWFNEFEPGADEVKEDDPVDEKEDDIPDTPTRTTEVPHAEETDENGDVLTQDELEGTLSEADKQELDSLNAKFKTDFKSLEEFQQALAKEKGPDPVIQEMAQKERSIEAIQSYLQYKPENLVYEDIKQQFANKGKDVTDPEVDQEIRDQIESMSANELSLHDRVVRQQLNEILNKNQSEVLQYKRTQVEQRENEEKARKEAISNETAKLFQRGDFFGLKLPKEAFIDTYKKVSTNKDIVSQAGQDPAKAVELQLLWDNREAIRKAMGGATYSDGVEATLKQIRGKGEKPVQKVRNDKTKGGLSDLISDWIK